MIDETARTNLALLSALDRVERLICPTLLMHVLPSEEDQPLYGKGPLDGTDDLSDASIPQSLVCPRSLNADLHHLMKGGP